jgi:hypothetical protein
MEKMMQTFINCALFLKIINSLNFKFNPKKKRFLTDKFNQNILITGKPHLNINAMSLFIQMKTL